MPNLLLYLRLYVWWLQVDIYLPLSVCYVGLTWQMYRYIHQLVLIYFGLVYFPDRWFARSHNHLWIWTSWPGVVIIWRSFFFCYINFQVCLNKCLIWQILYVHKLWATVTVASFSSFGSQIIAQLLSERLIPFVALDVRR